MNTIFHNSFQYFFGSKWDVVDVKNAWGPIMPTELPRLFRLEIKNFDQYDNCFESMMGIVDDLLATNIYTIDTFSID